MKISLIQPPNIQRKGKWKKQKVYRTPTNLALLASYIHSSGHEAVIHDLDIEGGAIHEMVSTIMADDPQVIGLTCLTPRFPIIKKISQECKKVNPDVIIVLGGPHISGQPKYIFEDSAIDYGVIGEGEGSIVDLLNHLSSGEDFSTIKNLVFRNNNKIISNPVRPFIEDLDSLPMAAWDLLKLDYYTDPAFFKGPHLGIMSARGCPNNCNFCASSVVWGRKVRFRSPENIVDEIDFSVKSLGISEFMFYDDTFTINRKRVFAICEEIERRKLEIRFYAQVRCDTIDYELAKAMKKAGCFAVAVGVESGDETILKNIGKRLKKEQIRAGCSALKKAKLPFLASYIIGHPGDNHQTIQATIDFANELDADQSKFLIATPYPGTKLFDLAVAQGIIPETGAQDLGEHTYFQHVAANLSDVSDEDLLYYQQKAFDDYDERKRPLI